VSSAGQLREWLRPPLSPGPAKGAVAVLVHGAMDRATSFTRLMAKLPDWTILTYDRRGYAGSFHLGPTDDFSTQVDDLESLLEDRPAVAFGHSLGGAVVLGTARRRPDLINTAVVWEPAVPGRMSSRNTRSPGAEGVEPSATAEAFMRHMVGDRIWERLPAATQQRRRSEGRALVTELAALRAAPRLDLAAIGIPVIVGCGTESTGERRDAARRLATALPNAELAEVPGAGHGAHIGHPGEVADLLRRALARRAAGA
jgi:pimeloyl-ACP methyl ester carboxylesterase